MGLIELDFRGPRTYETNLYLYRENNNACLAVLLAEWPSSSIGCCTTIIVIKYNSPRKLCDIRIN